MGWDAAFLPGDKKDCPDQIHPPARWGRPIRIGKETGHIPEIHDDKGQFAFRFTDPGAASDNLLEFRHESNGLIQHDQLRHFTIRTGRKQFGRRGNDRVGRGDGDKVVQLAFAIGIAAGDTDNVIRVLLHHVRIAVGKSNPHTYWTGPRQASFPERKPIVKWIPPIPIGMDWKRELPTTIRNVVNE